MSHQNIFLNKHKNKKTILKTLTKKFHVRNPNYKDNFPTSPLLNVLLIL